MKLLKINEDKRGDIHAIEDERLGYDEVAVFFTKKGMARGGCIHPNSDEFLLVVKGKIHYVAGNTELIMSDGTVVFTPKNTPHYFKALSDCIVMEWGASKSEKGHKDKNYKRIVDEINDPPD